MILVADLSLQTFVKGNLFGKFVLNFRLLCYEGRRIKAVFSLEIEYETFVLSSSTIGSEQIFKGRQGFLTSL